MNSLLSWWRSLRRVRPVEPIAPATWVPPGHFYSPIADLDDLAARAETVFNVSATSIAEIDLRLDDQRRLFDVIVRHTENLGLPTDPTPGWRYFSANDQFGPGDATVLAAMLIEHRPRRLIEIGSGFSSALILDVRERFLNGALDCTFIEPFPNRLEKLLGSGDRDRARLIRERIQLVDPAIVDTLAAGDVLFVDSTHVTKAGSDVNHIFFTLLPRLAPGVIVHFHDIFHPLEYPREWFFQGNRSWNEIYVLRAFLMNNPRYRILFFNSCFAHLFPDCRGVLPDFWKNPGGSFWMTKL